MKAGLYIVFEGIVGSGKTTHSKLLVERLKKEFPKREVVWTREPGGSEIAGAIRKIIQSNEFEEEIDPISETYLFAAARAQTLRKVVGPVLKRGGIVISDRSYATSVAYQGLGKGLSPKQVLEVNKIALGKIRPDIIIFLKVMPGVSLSRRRDIGADKFEKLGVEFFSKAMDSYAYAKKVFKGEWIDIDGSQDILEVHEKIMEKLKKILLHV